MLILLHKLAKQRFHVNVIVLTLALPRRQQSDCGLRLTQNEYFSLITHTKQLLSVTCCDTTAGIGAITQTHTRTHGGRTDRREVRKSYLDVSKMAKFFPTKGRWLKKLRILSMY